MQGEESVIVFFVFEFVLEKKSDGRTTKQLVWERTPEVLVLHLKRFRGMQKLTHRIQYPVTSLKAIFLFFFSFSMLNTSNIDRSEIVCMICRVWLFIGVARWKAAII
jgi:hypothetical protein